MPTETANYGFTKENEDEFYNVNTVNANLDKIDTEMKRIEDESKSFNQQVIDNTNAIAIVNTKLDTHIQEDDGHVWYVGGTNGTNAMTVTTEKIPMVNKEAHTLVPKTGVSFKFIKNGSNTGNVTLGIISGSKGTSSYPILNPDYSQLLSGQLVNGGIYTVAFNGTNFFLQGSGSGVNVTRGSQTFSTPGTHAFTVPKGVSKITMYAFGAGGGGGGWKDTQPQSCGGGGGGGAMLLASINVVGGQSIVVRVGKGGAGGGINQVGAQGGESGIVHNGVNYLAGGGGGGGVTSAITDGLGGQGGTYVNSGQTGIISNKTDGTFVKVGGIADASIIHCFTGGSGGTAASSSLQGGGGGGSASDLSGGLGANSGGSNGAAGPVYSNQSGGHGGVGALGSSGQPTEGYPKGGGGGGGNVYWINAKKGGDGYVILFW